MALSAACAAGRRRRPPASPRRRARRAIAGCPLRPRELLERTQIRSTCALEPAPRAARAGRADRCALSRSSARDGAQRRFEQRPPRREPRQHMPVPRDAEAATVARRSARTPRPPPRTSDLARRSSSSPSRRSAAASSRRLSASRAAGSTVKFEPDEMPDRLGPDADLAVGGDRHRQRVGAARADVTHQHRRPPVDEALGQPLMQRIGQPSLRPRGCARPNSPAPSASRHDARCRPSCECPRAGRRAPRYRRSTLSSRATSAANHSCGHVTSFADIAEEAAHHARVVHRPDLAEVGQSACRPQRPRLPTPLRAAMPGSSAIDLSTARSIASGAERRSGSPLGRLEAARSGCARR